MSWLFWVLAMCCIIGAFWGSRKGLSITVISFCLFGFLFVGMAMDSNLKHTEFQPSPKKEVMKP